MRPTATDPSGWARTGVCVVRVENQGPERFLITVTATRDVHRISVELSHRVADAESGLALVADFLRECCGTAEGE